MARRWHVEHADGREWTQDELDAVVKPGHVDHVCIDPAGNPYLLTERGEWWRFNIGDMRVVWDG